MPGGGWAPLELTDALLGKEHEAQKVPFNNVHC